MEKRLKCFSGGRKNNGKYEIKKKQNFSGAFKELSEKAGVRKIDIVCYGMRRQIFLSTALRREKAKSKTRFNREDKTLFRLAREKSNKCDVIKGIPYLRGFERYK